MPLVLGNEVECGRTMEHNIESSRRVLVNDQHLAYSQGKGRINILSFTLSCEYKQLKGMVN